MDFMPIPSTGDAEAVNPESKRTCGSVRLGLRSLSLSILQTKISWSIIWENVG
jgi:hypothetical protein